MRLEAQAKAGFYPTPPEVVEILKTYIGEKKPGPRRLLDPCCGTGEPAAEIASVADCDAYGVEIHTGRAQTARKLLKKVISGNLFSVRARHEAFSIVFLNPPYDFDSDDGRTELSFLKHALPYLTADGLLLYLIPQKRLTPRIARVLSAYIEDPQVRKFSEGQFKAFGQVVIAGLKRLRPKVNHEVFQRLQQAATGDVPEMIPGEFSFPVPTVSKDFFIRSSELIPEELAEELLTSSLWKEPALGALLENDETNTVIRPLMPPRKAHLAMLIAAGMINNQVLEAQNQRLLIKGTSRKVIDRFEEETEKGMKITEKERIVTEINAFDLNTGEYLQIL
jgi:predicted RNA methylase